MTAPRHGVSGWELVRYEREWMPHVSELVYERDGVRVTVLRGEKTGTLTVAETRRVG